MMLDAVSKSHLASVIHDQVAKYITVIVNAMFASDRSCVRDLGASI